MLVSARYVESTNNNLLFAEDISQKVSFSEEALVENIRAFMVALTNCKPENHKGIYIKVICPISKCFEELNLPCPSRNLGCSLEFHDGTKFQSRSFKHRSGITPIYALALIQSYLSR